MHGVVVQVKIDASREAEARAMLASTIVPSMKGQAGFKRGTWLRALEGDGGMSVMLFDTEAQARATADQVRADAPPPGAPTVQVSVGVYEIAAEA